jgi:beta-phosphoglucomutase-like phosphatase (HAD superfamily)
MTHSTESMRGGPVLGPPAIIFDYDGTLVDSVYQHVLAWKEAMAEVGIYLDTWSIHRRIGMSGGLMANAVLRETGHEVTYEEATRLLQLHAKAYSRLVGTVRPLTGARDLLVYLSQAGVPWAIATSGKSESTRLTLEALGVPAEVPIVTRDQVAHAKPDPDLFLAWIPMQGVPANKMPIGSKIECCVAVLVIGFTPRSAEATGRRYPRTSRKRLFPSHGTATSVSSNPEAISSGLWARFWNRTTISRSVIVTFAEASMKSRNKWRDLADS